MNPIKDKIANLFMNEPEGKEGFIFMLILAAIPITLTLVLIYLATR